MTENDSTVDPAAAALDLWNQNEDERRRIIELNIREVAATRQRVANFLALFADETRLEELPADAGDCYPDDPTDSFCEAGAAMRKFLIELRGQFVESRRARAAGLADDMNLLERGPYAIACQGEEWLVHGPHGPEATLRDRSAAARLAIRFNLAHLSGERKADPSAAHSGRVVPLRKVESTEPSPPVAAPDAGDKINPAVGGTE